MRGALIALATLLVACQSHTVSQCFPPCTASDQTFFAHCVAQGLEPDALLELTPEGCVAGNRRCCALASECLGPLDDQTVNTSATACEAALEDQCWPPCNSDAQGTFDLCVGMGTPNCAIGDEQCCALSLDCLGSVGDWEIYADGCCADAADCFDDEMCDPMTWECVPATSSGGCGDGMLDSSTEQCDDGNTVTEACAYGQMSCSVCKSNCTNGPGTTSFCGDGTVDAANGETCDPPTTTSASCDASCHDATPATCRNNTMDGAETDIDCGGRQCLACTSGHTCRVPSDCRTTSSACNETIDCDPAMGFCIEVSHCDDSDVCTHDSCGTTGGVTGCTFDTIDDDMDGFGPGSTCGGDCDDFVPTTFPGATELCDGVDNNCDGNIDEIC